jgi:hypothetical protein
MSIGFLKMRKKKSKIKDKTLFCANVYLDSDDWEATKKLAAKRNLSGADLVRAWMREGLEKDGKKGR